MSCRVSTDPMGVSHTVLCMMGGCAVTQEGRLHRRSRKVQRRAKFCVASSVRQALDTQKQSGSGAPPKAHLEGEVRPVPPLVNGQAYIRCRLACGGKQRAVQG